MDFVRAQNEIMLFAKLNDLGEFFVCVDAANWIVRIAQDEKACVGSDGFFHRIDIESPARIFPFEFCRDELPSLIGRSGKERRVDRGGGHDCFVVFGIRPAGQIEGRDEAG